MGVKPRQKTDKKRAPGDFQAPFFFFERPFLTRRQTEIAEDRAAGERLAARGAAELNTVIRRRVRRAAKSILKHFLSVDSDAETAGIPIEHEVVDLAAGPIDARVCFARMIPRVAVSHATVAPRELQRRGCVRTLLEGDRARVMAEGAEPVSRV